MTSRKPGPRAAAPIHRPGGRRCMHACVDGDAGARGDVHGWVVLVHMVCGSHSTGRLAAR